MGDGAAHHNFLVVVDMRSAVGAVVAVDALAGVALVGVRLEAALGDLQVALGDDLVERVGATVRVAASVWCTWQCMWCVSLPSEDLASVTVAATVSALPLSLLCKDGCDPYQRMCSCLGMVALHSV